MRRAAPGEHVSWCQIVQAFVVAAVIGVVDEAGDCALEVTGKIVVFEQDAAFQREVPSLELSLRHRMIWLAARMAHALVFETVGSPLAT